MQAPKEKVCKLQKRKCHSECTFAPYFPANDLARFSCVNKLYGHTNLGKMLQVMCYMVSSFDDKHILIVYINIYACKINFFNNVALQHLPPHLREDVTNNFTLKHSAGF